jgi:hypothetical protein
MPKRRKFPRHAFVFHVPQYRGHIKIWARTRLATQIVRLSINKDDVIAAIKARGAGNSQNCVAAMCMHRLAALFSHRVGSFCDFLPSRAYVSTSPADEEPKECVVYAHRDRRIWKWNDTPGGLRRLLAYIEQHGPQMLTLYPMVRQIGRRGGRKRGNNDGSRTARAHQVPTGMRVRYAFAHRGFGGDNAERQS